MNSIQIVKEAFNTNTTRFRVSSRLLDWTMERAERTGNDLIATGDGRLEYSENCWHCAYSDEYFSQREASESVNTSNGREVEARRSIIDIYAFLCSRSGEYYDNSAYSYVYIDYEKVCLERYEEEIYYWESDGHYHFEPESEGEGVDGYHAYSNSNAREEMFTMEGIGMELELQVMCERGEFANHAKSYGFLAEEDGSLDPRHGLELIAPPIPFEDWRAGKTMWHRLFNDAYDFSLAGHDAGTGYGIHLSISRSLFKSPLHLSKFIVFFNMAVNLTQVLAQRERIYSGDYRRQPKVKAGTYTGRYEPVSLDAHRLEVRVFRSNLRLDRIMKNVEYVQAVFEFTRLESIRTIESESRNAASFLSWLSLPSNRKTFPNLSAYIVERRDAIGQGDVSILKPIDEIRKSLPKERTI